MKIGSSSGSNQSGDNDPFAKERDLATFDEKPWEIFSRLVTDGLADEWFREIGLSKAGDHISAEQLTEDLKTLQLCFPHLETLPDGKDPDINFIKGFTTDFESLGEMVSISESDLGKTVLETMGELGLKSSFKTDFFVNDYQRVMMGNDDPMILAEIEKVGTTLESHWKNSRGAGVAQFFRVFRTKNGREVGLWSAPTLVATRPLVGIEEWSPVFAEGYTLISKIRDLGKWCRSISIPLMCKKLMFLAETPFPSAIMNFDRGMAWGEEIEKSRRPKPVLLVNRRAEANSLSSFDGTTSQSVGTIFPEVYELGWLFDTKDKNELKKILEIVTEGPVKVSEILQDGFNNFLLKDYPSPYEWVTFSLGWLSAERESGGLSKSSEAMPNFIPVQEIGTEIQATQRILDQLVDSSLPDGVIREKLCEVTYNGVGPYWANCANDLIWRYLIPEQDWEEIEYLAKRVALADIHEQSTNALSNSGIALYLQGKLDAATEQLESALMRSDKFSEAEASWWLAKIHAERGDLERSEKYALRCKEAGGYSDPVLELQKGTITPKAKMEDSSLNEAPFCGQCGNRFPAQESNFCPNCGSKRI